MKQKIYYWSPCLNPVGTVKSTMNSAISLKKYGGQNYDVYLINACGEWNEFRDLLIQNEVKILDFNLNYFKLLPKEGYLQSRFSYLIIFFLSFIPLIKLIKNSRPDFIIAHLITSLPLTIMYLFNFQTEFILRISGMPKLNFLRKNFWRLVSKDISFITCPSNELKEKLLEIDLFPKEKLYFLPDAIFSIKEFIKKKNTQCNYKFFDKQKNILTIGRLTKQKNFSFLIDEFSIFYKENKNFNLLIIGDGEEKDKLQAQINLKNLQKNVFLLGRVENVFNLIKKSEIFILSSLWEDPGFVLIEAGLGNLFVISSNCPNGPKEILNFGKNGYLYESNKKYELVKKLYEYIQLDNKTKFEMKTKLKKNITKYSIFKHYLYFKKIIND